jgi:VWFA-related protein
LYFDLPYGSSYPPGSSFPADTAQGQIFVSAKKYIADYLRTMPAGTEVAVFVYRSDYGLRLLQGFTTDGAKAAAAVDNLVVLSVGKPPSADPVAAANQIAAYVAGVHGRNNLIWIGSPLPIMRDGGQSWGFQNMTMVHRLMDTYDNFTREQIAIYPFDPMGVPAPGLFVGKQPPALGFATLRAEDIATETGGGAIYNTNDFKSAVAKIVDETSHFYTLSYIPPRQYDDGHYHPIKIAVDRPGLHLTYRNGYNDEHPTPPDAVLKVHMDQSSMGLGALPSTQINLDIRVTPGVPDPAATPAKSASSRRALAISGKTQVPYSIIYNLDQSQIDFAVTPDGVRRTSLEFDLAAYDPYGKLLTVRSQTLTLTLSSGQYEEFVLRPFKFVLPIDLPPGQLTLRAGVFDTAASKAGTLEVPLTIPKK